MTIDSTMIFSLVSAVVAILGSIVTVYRMIVETRSDVADQWRDLNHDLRAELARLESRLTEAQNAIQITVLQRDEEAKRRAQIAAAFDAVRAQNDDLRAEVAQQQQEITNLRAEVAQQQQHKIAQQHEIETLRAEVAQLRAQFGDRHEP